MKLSVLICTYNRHELLRSALRALIEETIEKPDQVVIVNGGDEKADQVVQEFLNRKNIEIKLIKVKNINLASNRNAGIPACTGDVIAMTDDDAKVFPDWVTRMKQIHQEHPEAGAIGGMVIGTNTESLVGKVADLMTFPVWDRPCYVRTLPGVNISYKKEVIQKIGMQDIVLFRGEDVDYNWRVLQAGYKVYFDPSIKVYHYHRPTLAGLIHQHYMYGRAYYLVRRKWPAMYCIYPHQFHRPKDFLKAVNFILSTFYQPLLNICRLSNWKDHFSAAPIFFMTGLAWKMGMVTQALKNTKD